MKASQFAKVLVTILFLYFLSIGIILVYVPVVKQKPGMIFYVRPGLSKKSLIEELAARHLIPNKVIFSAYIYLQPQRQLKTGEYFFPYHATQTMIWEQVTKGKGLMNHPFTIIPGWTFAQLRQALQNAEGLTQTVRQLSDQAVMQALNAKVTTPEGEFFPDTYYYSKGLTDIVILKKAYSRMQDKLNVAWNARAAELPYKNAYEALIAASLIEKETHIPAERPIIAGVLINRLEKNMLLQFDPTVIYGLGDSYRGQIYKSDLIKDSPYNTYLHKGLPPTPIAMPSYASINAALHPTQHDYYYFVAKGDGGHQFSQNLLQHNNAIALAENHLHNYFNQSVIKTYMLPLLQGEINAEANGE